MARGSSVCMIRLSGSLTGYLSADCSPEHCGRRARAGLGQYWDLFNELGIDSTSFPLLTLQDLYSLGVDNVTDRKRMFQLIVDTRNAPPPDSGAGPAEDPRAQQVSEEQKQRDRDQREREQRERQARHDRQREQQEERHREERAQRERDRAAAREQGPMRALPAEARRAAPGPKAPKKNVLPKGARISVCVRKRPLNPNELRRQERDIVKVVDGVVCLHEPKERVDLSKYVEKHQFRFDEAFDETMTNVDIYQLTAAPLIQSVFDGVKATCFAYGQTGSGKTFTMMGPSNDDGRSPNSGLITLAACDFFKRLQGKPDLSLMCCFFEIYSGKLYGKPPTLSSGRETSFGSDQSEGFGPQTS